GVILQADERVEVGDVLPLAENAGAYITVGYGARGGALLLDRPAQGRRVGRRRQHPHPPIAAPQREAVAPSIEVEAAIGQRHVAAGQQRRELAARTGWRPPHAAGGR